MTSHSRIAARLVYQGQEWLLRRPTFRYLSELECSQWLSRKELEELQGIKLKSLLRIARDHCPWHAENIAMAGLALETNEPTTLDELRRLPRMDKSDAQLARDRMVWRGVPGGAHKYNTGGSSGSPLIFYFGRWRQASDAAGRMRARRWWGVEPGDREVYVWGAPVELGKTDRVKTVRDRALNQLVLNAFEMSPAKMDDYMDKIRVYQPSCVYGYASSIALLASRAKEKGTAIRTPHLKVVCTTGEPLYPNQRDLIENVFDVPVANEFGSRDIGFTAHEAPSGQVLLMSESIILEILDDDGRPVAPGDIGEAVMTGLCSQAQPFIRYRTGDMLRMADESCRDGRGLHVLGEVFGRKTDFIVRADGTIMHALAVIYVLRAVDGIREFKFIQHSIREVEVLVVPNERWQRTAENEIKKGIRKRLGSTVEVDICLVDSIAAESSGKYRYVVSHVPLPAAFVGQSEQEKGNGHRQAS